MVSSLSFSPFKVRLPGIIPTVRLLSRNPCFSHAQPKLSLCTQINLYCFSAILEVNTHTHRWLRVLNLDRHSLHLTWKNFGKISQYHYVWPTANSFEPKFIWQRSWHKIVWKPLFQKHWDFNRNCEETTVYSAVTWSWSFPWAQGRTVHMGTIVFQSWLEKYLSIYFFWNFNSLWCFKDLFLARNLFHKGNIISLLNFQLLWRWLWKCSLSL